MKKDCSTCICKEGSCYPSTTIFDKDKTCKSYAPDYEGYITDLEQENAELKTLIKSEHEIEARKNNSLISQITTAKELLKKWVELFKPKGGNIPPTPIQVDTEQFLNGEGCPDCFCEDCTKEDCGIKKLGLVEVEK